MRRTDKLLVYDTGSITGSTDTLSAAITSTSANAITVTSGAMVRNGTYIQVGSERMYVTAGGGTSSLTVDRGGWGTTAATHLNGATVTVAGALTVAVFKISDVPNRPFSFQKISGDLNYVLLSAFSGDTFDSNGSTAIILADNSAALGTQTMTAPAVGNQWLRVGGAGAAGVAGSSGGGGGTPAAPNVTSATVAVSFIPFANAQNFVFSGSFSLPTSDPNYSHDQRVDVMAVDAAGNMSLVATFAGTPVGSPTSFTGVIGLQPSTTQTYSCKFICYNEAGAPTAGPYTITGISVTAAGLGSVSGAEIGPVYQDSNQGLHTVIALTPVVSGGQLPMVVTFAIDFADGRGPVLQGWTTFSAPGESWVLGQATASTPGTSGAGSIWVPTDPTHGTWTVYAAPGAIDNVADLLASPSLVGATFTVAVAQACLPSDCTNIEFIPNPATGDTMNYVLGGNGQYDWIFNELDFLQPTATYDPYYQYALLTVQKGYASTGSGAISGGVNLHDAGATFTAGQVGNVIHVAGTWALIAGFTDSTHVVLSVSFATGGYSYEIWNPAPDYEGANEDQDLLFYGRNFATSGDPNGGPEVLGSTVQVIGDNPPDWTFPPPTNPDGSTNLYRTFKFEVYAVSRLGQNPNGGPQSGTYTRQNGWPGGLDHAYLTPAAQPSALDLSQASSGSTGHGLIVTSGKLQGAVGNGVGFDGSGNIVTKLGNGLGIDGSGNNVAKLAGGLTFDGSGNSTADLGYTMHLDSLGKIALSNLPAVFGLPSLPSATYPAGAVILDTADNKIYRNPSGSAWLVSSAPADIVAGAIATGVTLAAAQVTAGTFIGGVIYAGAIACSQLLAGTVNVSLTLTAPTLIITSGTVTINIDGTNQILINDTSAHESMHITSHNAICSSTVNSARTAMAVNSFQAVDSTASNFMTLTPTALSFNSQQVVGPRVAVRPVTLTDVINLLVTHGLSA